MATNSRKGKRIARAACDMCRERKVQCLFSDTHMKCMRCERAEIPCTFITERRPRGPASRLVEQAKSKASQSPPTPSHGEELRCSVQLEHFCTREIFLDIFDDFVHLLYPVVPLVHLPTIRAQILRCEYSRNQAVLRQCLALAATTVASLPRKFSIYFADSSYTSASSAVMRAIQLVQMSRVMDDPLYVSHPNTEHLSTSMMLCLGAHYVTDTNQGWHFANEVALFSRCMFLAERGGYEGVPLLDAELRKRTFWCGYIVQIHDRISAIAPHTGLSYLPRSVDWDFIVPLALHDEDLLDERSVVNGTRNETELPSIVGFVALIKVFRCCADLFSFGIPGSVNQAYSMASGPVVSQLLPSSPESPASISNAHAPSRGLAAIVDIFHALGSIMESLPQELRFDGPGHEQPSPNGTDHLPDPFKIMAANIHITSLYLQSAILETFASSTRTVVSADMSDEATRVRTQIWTLRESIAQELLQLLESCPPWTVEANGASMIGKIREIASTLLNSDEDEGLRQAEQEATSREYVQKFVEILSNLDFGARRGEAATNWSGT